MFSSVQGLQAVGRPIHATWRAKPESTHTRSQDRADQVTRRPTVSLTRAFALRLCAVRQPGSGGGNSGLGFDAADRTACLEHPARRLFRQLCLKMAACKAAVFFLLLALSAHCGAFCFQTGPRRRYLRAVDADRWCFAGGHIWVGPVRRWAVEKSRPVFNVKLLWTA